MINIGKVKKGTKNVKFVWGHSDFSNKNFIPSSTTLIISKDFSKRKALIENITCNEEPCEIIQLSNLEPVILVEELNTYKQEIENRLKKNCNNTKYILCLDDYDLLLYKHPTLVKDYINFINDYGKRVGVFLLLGCNTINTNFIDSVDNIILLPPYDVQYLIYIFKNSIYNIINSTDPIGQFQTANGVKIDQVENEPAILKNGNNIYLYIEK